MLRVLGAGLVVTISGWALYWKPRPKPPEAGTAEMSLAADHQAYLRERTAALIQAGRWQEAEPLEEELLRSQPGNPDLLRQDAELQARLGHDLQAVDLWFRFRKVAPSSAAFCPAQGDACLRLGHLQEAIGTFQAAIALEPGNASFSLALARAYEQDRQYGQAEEAYAQACRLDPLLEPARLGLARTQHQRGEHRQALDNLARVLRDAPENGEAVLLDAMLLQKAGRYLQARKVLEKGLALAPNDKNIMLALARLAEATGQFKVAVGWLERVLAQFQGVPAAPVAPSPARQASPAKAARLPATQAPARARHARTRRSRAVEPSAVSGRPEAPASPPGAPPSLTTLTRSDLPRVLAQGARQLRAMASDHWILRLEVAFLPVTLRASAASFPDGAPGLFLLPITAGSGAKGYQLLLGDFGSRAAAEAAIRTLPARFRTHGQRPIPCQAQALKAGAAP